MGYGKSLDWATALRSVMTEVHQRHVHRRYGCTVQQESPTRHHRVSSAAEEPERHATCAQPDAGGSPQGMTQRLAAVGFSRPPPPLVFFFGVAAHSSELVRIVGCAGGLESQGRAVCHGRTTTSRIEPRRSPALVGSRASAAAARLNANARRLGAASGRTAESTRHSSAASPAASG